jgi:fructose-1,6-bisphosphatase/inositol monophosphatase family enzyme
MVKKVKKVKQAKQPLDLNAEIAELHVLLRALGEEAIMMRNGGKLAEKEDSYSGDIVTAADKLIEQEMVKRIAMRHPGHYVRGVQGYMQGEPTARYKWIINPIDGTRNFTKGLDFFAIAVALVDKDIPIMGVLYFPELHRFVSAIKGKGVRDNGKSLKVFARPDTKEMTHALIAGSTTRRKSGRTEMLGMLRAASLNVVNTGSTAYNAMLLVERKLDAVINADTTMFNVVALVPIFQEAGCVVADFQHEHLDLRISSILQKDPAMFADDLLDAGGEKDRMPFIAATNKKLLDDIKKRILPIWKKSER